MFNLIIINGGQIQNKCRVFPLDIKLNELISYARQIIYDNPLNQQAYRRILTILRLLNGFTMDFDFTCIGDLMLWPPLKTAITRNGWA